MATTNAELRLRFFRYLWKNMRIIWPILSGLVGFQLALGAVIGFPRAVVSERHDLFHVRDRSHNRLWGSGPEAHYLADDCIGDRLLRHTADGPCRRARGALAPRGGQGRIAPAFPSAMVPISLSFSVGTLVSSVCSRARGSERPTAAGAADKQPSFMWIVPMPASAGEGAAT